jgi:hypothetical protein
LDDLGPPIAQIEDPFSGVTVLVSWHYDSGLRVRYVEMANEIGDRYALIPVAFDDGELGLAREEI